MKFFILFLFFLTFVTTNSKGQSPLRVVTDFSAEHIIRKILLNNESNITVSNIKYTGSHMAIGAFSNSSKYYIMKKGIILSTGDVMEAIGPNTKTDNGIVLGSGGSKILQKIATGKTYDACELSFDFIPDFDSITFNFLFASEEYPEYVHKGVNDIFGFFLEDIESGEMINLAVIGKPAKPINVDNINSERNSDLYIENGVWDPNNILQWQHNRGLGELALTYEYDGFSTLLAVGSSVIPGNKYRIRFAIADVGDPLYDSAVFLKEGSFKSSGNNEDSSMKKLLDELSQDFTEPSVELSNGKESIVLSLQINFEFDDSKITADSSIHILNKIARLMRFHSELDIFIKGYTDNYGTEEYNLNLSEQRAHFAAEFLIQSGINNNRLKTEGFGDNNPISDNITDRGRQKNRRIEFEFYNSK